MQIPQYWAQGRSQRRVGGRQVTTRRWGWSDLSQDAAQAHGDARAAEALERIWQGSKEARREAKRAYNGADGVPIREEVLQRVDDRTVVTRNAYGAHCLNSAELFMADLDFAAPGLKPRSLLWMLGLALLLGLPFGLKGQVGLAMLVALLAALTLPLAMRGLQRLRTALAGGTLQQTLRRVQAFAATRPDWRLRCYQTPAGLRVLAVHRAMDPTSAESRDALNALGSDPIYNRMCERQACFRARLTGKPWRMGIDAHIRPRRAVWPLDASRLALRQAWVERYDVQASRHAACRFLFEIGDAPVDPRLAAPLALHDQACRALGELPLA